MAGTAGAEETLQGQDRVFEEQRREDGLGSDLRCNKILIRYGGDLNRNMERTEILREIIQVCTCDWKEELSRAMKDTSMKEIQGSST